MHIKTERGWRPLQTAPMNKLGQEPPRYQGPLPSREALAYIAGLEAEHVEWVARRAQMVADQEAA